MSLQRQLGPSSVVTTAYVGSSSRHLQRLYNINAAEPGDSRTEAARRMIPSLGAITMTDSAGSASYHGLQATVDKRLSDGWRGSLSYTWSHSIDDVLELAGGEGNMVSQDWRHLPGDRGNSGFRSAAPAGCARSRRSPLRCRSPLVAGRRCDGRPARRLAGVGDRLGAVRRLLRRHGARPTNRLGVTPGSSVWRPDLMGDPSVSDPTADAWLNPAAFAIPQNPDGTARYRNLDEIPCSVLVTSTWTPR